MAGIGFQLRRLARQDTISAVVAAAGHGAVIAAGPWLFTILSIAAISLLTADLVGLGRLATFRVIIIYAFALSLVLTAPVTIIVTRLLADALWMRRPERARGLLVGAFSLAVALSAAGVAATVAAFPLPPAAALTLAACTMTVSMIWVALCFCGAVRDYRSVTTAFFIGLLVSLLASVAAAVLEGSPAGMAFGFLTGLAVTLLGITGCVLRTFPAPLLDPLEGLQALAEGIVRYWPLALGGMLGAAAVWIDKWVVWGMIGERVEGGLVHAPLYDSAMFIASLAIIPSLSAFVIKLETDFFERYQRYYATIQSHGTLAQIEDTRASLESYTLETMALVTVVQAGICAVLILAAPMLIEALGLQFRQISILRYGALGVVFQFIYVAATALLLFFDRRMLFLRLQAANLALNAGLTLVTIALGETFHGIGFFLSTFVVAALAYAAASRTFRDLNYLTFIGNNPSVRAGSAGAAR